MVRRQAEQIDRHDHPRHEPASRGGRHGPPRAVGRDVEGLGIDICKYRGGAQQCYHFGGRAERERRADHRIAGADALGHQHHQQRVGAAGAGYRMAGPAKRRQCGFEFPHLGSEHELTMIEHARDRRIDAAAQAAPLRRHVDERNGRGGDPGVLVHERTSAARARRGAATATRRVDFAANSAG